MVVFCPGCGSKISVQPGVPGGDVECPRCHSTFATAGVKPADAAPPPKRFRPKKAGRGKLAGVAIVLAVLAMLGGGTTAILYFTGVMHFGRSSASPSAGTRATDKSREGTGPAAPPGWKEFVTSEAHFRALFPGDPKRKPRTLTTPTGKVHDVAFELEKDGVAYGVVYADLDQPGLRNVTPEQFIDRERDRLVGSGKLVGQQDVTGGSYQGKGFVVDLPNQGKAHVRFFAAGRRLYSVVVSGKSRAPDPADVAKMFDSFQITG